MSQLCIILIIMPCKHTRSRLTVFGILSIHGKLCWHHCHRVSIHYADPGVRNGCAQSHNDDPIIPSGTSGQTEAAPPQAVRLRLRLRQRAETFRTSTNRRRLLKQIIGPVFSLCSGSEKAVFSVWFCPVAGCNLLNLLLIRLIWRNMEMRILCAADGAGFCRCFGTD